MYTYICFLRAVNVGGKNKLNMLDLSNSLLELKFKNIKTYLQSGNFIFESSNQDLPTIEKNIELLILRKFNITTVAFIFKREQLSSILENIPFINAQSNSLYFTLIKKSNHTLLNNHEIVSKYSPDLYLIKNEIVYINCEMRYGKTKLNNAFFEKLLQTQATTRNYNSLINIISLSNSNKE